VLETVSELPEGPSRESGGLGMEAIQVLEGEDALREGCLQLIEAETCGEKGVDCLQADQITSPIPSAGLWMEDPDSREQVDELHAGTGLGRELVDREPSNHVFDRRSITSPDIVVTQR
jgi:hypothetical protein